MSLRPSQLALRINAAEPDEGRRWQDGAALAYLGGILTLRLDTSLKDAARQGDELHIPLPPQATPRQIRDRAEAWLRQEALALFGAHVSQLAEQTGRRAPRVQLSFAARSHWAVGEDDSSVRCNWRLIEQTPDVIGQALSRAIRSLPSTDAQAQIGDLFAC